MSGGEWVTQKERRQLATDAREQARAAKRQAAIAWADSFWLAQNHPCDDALLAWLSEHRQECSKIGANRWHLETLPGLVATQQKLRNAAAFAAVLDRAKVSHQTLTAQDVLASAGFPQVQPGENSKTPRTNKGRRQANRKQRTKQPTTSTK